MNGHDNLDLKEYKSKETRLYGELMKICRSYSDELNLISVLGILDIVKQGLKHLDHQSGDTILLCRGDCFDLVREYFESDDITYESTKIEGILQDAVEGRLVSHLRKLGIKSRNLTY